MSDRNKGLGYNLWNLFACVRDSRVGGRDRERYFVEDKIRKETVRQKYKWREYCGRNQKNRISMTWKKGGQCERDSNGEVDRKREYCTSTRKYKGAVSVTGISVTYELQ